MKRTYEVRDRADKRAIREFLKREGQFLLPMLELVEQTWRASISEVAPAPSSAWDRIRSVGCEGP